MLDRQDIDALLVSALYGELTPADEARLATHLESHPGDRAALDDLKVAREAVRESRIFEVQLDPPQSLSAILLQEAARRAPRKVDAERGESWFARFVRTFVAHPAMAAAATLVLVVGVAGTLYLRKGSDQFAEQTAKGEESTATRTDEAPALAQPSSGAAAGSATRPSDDGVDVKLADTNESKNDIRNAPRPDPVKTEKPAATPARERQEVASHDRGAALKKKPEKIEVSRPEPAPKDLELAKSDADEGRFASPPGRSSAAGGGAAGAAGSTATTTTGLVGGPQQAQAPVAPPPPPSPSPALATVDKAPTTPTAKPEANKGAAKEDPTSSWARDTHQRMTALVRAGKCPDAAPLAVQIRNRAPDYYNSYVANDRALKPCMQYINDAAERDAEKSQKSRPAKRSESVDNAK